MLIVLSQHIVYESDYEDIPFSIYHFPKRYRNQIHPGDCFIYYQGDRHKKDNRYYFGCGVIGDVFPDAVGEFYYAKILDGKPFKKNIPIYHSNTKSVELGYTCGKTFAVSVFAVIEDGGSNILNLVKKSG